jgi:methyl-accepting chemotaxis protein
MAPKTRRRTILIDPGFQIRFSIYVVSWIFVLSVIYPVLIYQIFEHFVEFIIPTSHPALMEAVDKEKSKIIVLLTLLHGLLMGIVFLLSIFLSHRIAGPIYKLKQFIHSALQGNFRTDLTFRKSDHFKELGEEFNILMKKIDDDTNRSHVIVRDSIYKLETLSIDLKGEQKKQIEESLVLLKQTLHQTK